MKKMVIFLVAAMIVAAIGLLPGRALPSTHIKITGTVTDGGRPQVGLNVRVECWSSNFQAHATTDAHGVYTATGTEADCRPGTRIKVRVETSTKIGYNYGVAEQLVLVNVGMVPKTVVPEYGLIGGVVGACAIVSTFAIVRYSGNTKIKRSKA